MMETLRFNGAGWVTTTPASQQQQPFQRHCIREKTGKGQFVSTSLYRQGAYTVGFDMNIALLWGMTLSVGKRETMGNVAINNYIAGDGKRFWIVGLEDSVIGLRFVELLGIRNGWKMNVSLTPISSNQRW